MARVLIIGAGGVGSVVAHKCAQNPEVFTEIMLASRTVSKCDAIAASIKERTGRIIETARVNADDVPELDLPDPMPGETREYPSEKEGYYPVIVSTGLSDAQNVEITSGLEDGDMVFVNYTVTDSGSSW